MLQSRGARRVQQAPRLTTPVELQNLGAFDLDRRPGAAVTDAERARFEALFRRVAVLEVTGRVSFESLVRTISDLLS
ncbi:MAG: hypothetical protein DME04_15990 [Candidatus Rokuibacteriota bacterium]|nr:MAG: hypothetical protein DME04_15990 [Candidatus Rokubacteria bacterium]